MDKTIYVEKESLYKCLASSATYQNQMPDQKSNRKNYFFPLINRYILSRREPLCKQCKLDTWFLKASVKSITKMEFSDISTRKGINCHLFFKKKSPTYALSSWQQKSGQWDTCNPPEIKCTWESMNPGTTTFPPRFNSLVPFPAKY